MRPMPPSVGPRMPMYPPGGPGIGQQVFYGQAPPAMIPGQVDFSLLLLAFSHSHIITSFQLIFEHPIS